MQNSLVINTQDCVGCYACEIACKQAHNLPVGPRLIRVISDGPQEIDGKLQLRFTVNHCLHCKNPPCQAACPVKAIKTRDDGIAVIDETLCDGCQKCLESCPYGMMQFNGLNQKAVKCDLCLERLDEGRQPACVATCPSHCIYFGDRKKVQKKVPKSPLSAVGAEAR
jgi:Fe-S-cluster-containing dehydrogenase component